MRPIKPAERDAMYAKMFASFNCIYPLSKPLEDALRAASEVVSFKRKSVLLQHHEVCRYCYFALKGLVHAYYVGNKGQEVTSWFMKEGDIIISVRSFFMQEPSYEVLVALENTVCIALRYDRLMAIYDAFPEFNFTGRRLTELYYIQMEERAFSLRMDQAKDAYERFLRQWPDLVTRVPLKYIASHLGIEPGTLSRIRRDAANFLTNVNV